jgi:DNA ligase-1
MGVKTVNKVRKNLVPVFACQLAHKFEEKRCKTWPMTVEPKLDGVRCLAIATAGDVEFVSRTGRVFTSFDHLKEPLMEAVAAWEKAGARAGGIVLDGEVVSGSFNKTVSEVRKKETEAKDARFFAFDILPLEDFKAADLIDVPFSDRRDTLRQFLKRFDKEAPFKLLPSYIVNSVEEIHFYNAKFRGKKLEGTIVKDRAAPYKKSRSHGWLKIKAQESVDVRVTGVFEGTGKYKGHLGGLVVDVDGKEVRVGGGFSDGQRVDFWNDQGSVVGRLIEVEYHEKTPDGSLRHPRFVKFRDDKDEELAA